MNQEFLDEESSAAGVNAAGQPVASAEDASSTTIEREQQQMALEVGNSPKLAKRGAVKELEKQPNGSFLASEATLQETLSPKPARSTRTSKVSTAKKSPFLKNIFVSQCSAARSIGM